MEYIIISKCYKENLYYKKLIVNGIRDCVSLHEFLFFNESFESIFFALYIYLLLLQWRGLFYVIFTLECFSNTFFLRIGNEIGRAHV